MKTIEDAVSGLQTRLNAPYPDTFFVKGAQVWDRPAVEIKVLDATKLNFFYRFIIDFEYLDQTDQFDIFLDGIVDSIISDRLKGKHL